MKYEETIRLIPQFSVVSLPISSFVLMDHNVIFPIAVQLQLYVYSLYESQNVFLPFLFADEEAIIIIV